MAGKICDTPMRPDRFFPELLPDSIDDRPEGEEAEEEMLREFQAFISGKC